MNALQRLQIGAGPKVHEKIYEAVFTWRDFQMPCTHGEILRNPQLIAGGWSPNVLVTVGVREEAFPAAAGANRPKKGDNCQLETLTETLALVIGEARSGAGEVVHQFVLWDRSQRA